VLAELARGLTTKEIAAALLLGESTVKTHLGTDLLEAGGLRAPPRRR
jgi:DNA-binding NarL/FixJ family response regulator